MGVQYDCHGVQCPIQLLPEFKDSGHSSQLRLWYQVPVS